MESHANQDSLQTILLTVLAITYPFHEILRTSAGSVNLSLGDGVIFIVGILLMFGIFGKVKLPKVVFASVVLVLVPASSLAVNALRPEFMLPAGIREAVKLVASVSWGVGVSILISRNPRRGIWQFMTLSVCIAIIFTTLATVQSVVFDAVRPSGPFGNPNLFADYILLNFFFLLTLIDWDDRIQLDNPLTVTGFVFASASLLIALIGTSSRSAFVALLIGLIFSFRWVYQMRDNPLQMFISIGFSTIGIFGLLVFLQFQRRSMLSRFMAVLNGEQTGSRGTLWQRSFEAFASEPIFGIGWGQLRFTIDTTGIPPTTHNTTIRFFTESGLIGGLTFVAFATLVIGSTLHMRFNGVPHARFLGGYFVAVFANSMFHDMINFRSFWIGFAILGGFLLIVHDEQTTSKG